MPLHVADFPLTHIDNLIYGKTQSSPVLTANDPQTAALTVLFLNDRHAIQEKFHREGDQPLGIAFDNRGMLVSRLG